MVGDLAWLDMLTRACRNVPGEPQATVSRLGVAAMPQRLCQLENREELLNQNTARNPPDQGAFPPRIARRRLLHRVCSFIAARLEAAPRVFCRGLPPVSPECTLVVPPLSGVPECRLLTGSRRVDRSESTSRYVAKKSLAYLVVVVVKEDNEAVNRCVA